MQLNPESIQAARQWFHDNAVSCIAEVKSGKVRVNNPERYIENCLTRATNALEGKGDNTFAFAQRAYWIQTGEMVPFLPS